MPYETKVKGAVVSAKGLSDHLIREKKEFGLCLPDEWQISNDLFLIRFLKLYYITESPGSILSVLPDDPSGYRSGYHTASW